MVNGRMSYAPEGDYFVQCSFDKNHVLLRSRMPYHIIKCIKHFPNHNKIQCPYDATEYIDEKDFSHHILNCESAEPSGLSRELIERAYLKESQNLCNSERAPPAYHHASAPEVTEVWKAANASGTPEEEVYDPLEAIKEGRELRGCGRGVSLKKEKKGLGRAEAMSRWLKQYEDMKALKEHGSLPSSSHSSLSKPTSGQFEDP